MCLYVDCESFKLALWPALRQKFMNFWSFLTRSGDKHDKKISNKRAIIALRLLVKILLNFVIDIPSYMGHILLIMSEYHVKMQAGMFYFLICLFST